MRIKLAKFGEMLTSRPAGREAYLAAKAYVVSTSAEEIVIDFEGVKVLGPSWADEFIGRFMADQPGKVSFEHTDNPSVQATLKLLHHTPTPSL